MARNKTKPASPRKKRTTSRRKGPRPEGDAIPPAAAPVTTLASRGRMEPPRTGVTVRMYRTGLGDCFLLAFPRGTPVPQRPREAFYMLVDCGVFFRTPGPDN